MAGSSSPTDLCFRLLARDQDTPGRQGLQLSVAVVAFGRTYFKRHIQTSITSVINAPATARPAHPHYSISFTGKTMVAMSPTSRILLAALLFGETADKKPHWHPGDFISSLSPPHD